MPLDLPLVLAILVAIFRDRADLVAENLVLHQQLSALLHRGKRPRLRPFDRALWALLSHTLVSVAAAPRHRQAQYGHRLAPQGLSTVLAMEEPPATWSRSTTFLANHRHELLAIDFAVLPTITFDVLYVFFVLSVDRRRILTST